MFARYGSAYARMSSSNERRGLASCPAASASLLASPLDPTSAGSSWRTQGCHQTPARRPLVRLEDEVDGNAVALHGTGLCTSSCFSLSSASTNVGVSCETSSQSSNGSSSSRSPTSERARSTSFVRCGTCSVPNSSFTKSRTTSLSTDSIGRPAIGIATSISAGLCWVAAMAARMGSARGARPAHACFEQRRAGAVDPAVASAFAGSTISANTARSRPSARSASIPVVTSPAATSCC